MYTLRSGASYAKATENTTQLSQTTIPFRKRRRAGVEGASGIKEAQLADTNTTPLQTVSPPKRTKQEDTMPVTRSTRSAARKALGGDKELKPRLERLDTPLRMPRKPRPSSSYMKPRPPTPQSPPTPQRSPLKDRNTVVGSGSPKTPLHHNDVISNDQATPTKTPCSAARSVMKRLNFKDYSSLNDVKRSLHNSLPSTLHCRESQLTTLTTYISSHLTHHTPGSLYISGAPGTGKTACLTHILHESSSCEWLRDTSVVSVNCMSVKRPQAIYSMIATELLGKEAALRLRSVAALQDALVKHITSSKRMIVIVLDEVDQLDTRGQEVLYTIFEWPALKASKLLLIGIANALDLTDRILPRLQSHVKCHPALVHFPPYTREEIATILHCRLGDRENTQTVFDSMAIQFAARKVAAVHGDVRKALDICRRAVELVETERRCSKPHPPETTPTPHPQQPLRVTVKHISSVISEVYSSTITSQASQQSLPLQQKIAVCVLLCVLRGRAREVTVGGLHEAYVRVCRRRQLKAEGESEFVGVCEMLETRGIVGLKKGKGTRMMKVCLKLNQGELEHAIQDKVLLSSILEHGVPAS